jgi:nucleoside-diphosphate-sugar epimerase
VSFESDRGKPVVVTGAGGFIGGHLVAALLRLGTNLLCLVGASYVWYVINRK